MPRKSKPAYLLSLLAMLMTGCTSTAPSSDFCANAFDIGLAADEHLDDNNAKKIEAMDKYGITHCGW